MSLLKKLEDKYLGTSVLFEGNDDVESFYGSVVGFGEETDGSIYVSLRDMEDNVFDIDWDEVKDEEFDLDD